MHVPRLHAHYNECVCFPRVCVHSFEFKYFWVVLTTLVYVYVDLVASDLGSG
jgi:hypothetical protein